MSERIITSEIVSDNIKSQSENSTVSGIANMLRAGDSFTSVVDKLHNLCDSDIKKIMPVVDSLPQDYSTPLRMYITGHSYDDVAQALDLPLTTIKNRVNHAVVMLIRNSR